MSVDPRRPVSPEDRIADEFRQIHEKLKQLSAPSGSQINRNVQKLTELTENLQQQLDDYIANDAYTKAQVDARIATGVASPPGDVAAAGTVSGANLSTGGTVSGGALSTGGTVSGGALSIGGDGTVGGAFRAPNAVGYNITSTRRTAWLQDSDGRLGYAPSTLRAKTDVRPADIDPAAVLAVEPVAFRYREQVELQGDDAPVEVGFIAEQLDELGLGQWVYYSADGEPEGIEYSMLVVAQHALLRSMGERLDALEALLRR